MGNPNLPKQLMTVADKPILIHTLERFEAHDKIDVVYLVVGENQLVATRKLLEEHNITKVRQIVPGGDSAHGSIVNGIFAAKEDGLDDDAIVLIHDGVRPILPADLITANIKSVLELGSGITSVPAYETVGISRDGRTVEGVPERSEMYALQAPQAFRLGRVMEVNKRAIADGKLGAFVDQAHLMNTYNEKIHLVRGIRGNVKITVPDDFRYFSFLCESGEYERILRGEA